jgi:pSer/pThr/pTyr-binding forkhead associated (FHA) protein
MAAMDAHPDDEPRELDEIEPDDGDPTVTYRPVPPRPDTTPARARVAGKFRYALTVERGPQAGLTYVLGEGQTLAGRSDDVDIFLGDVTVSRHHVRFTVDEAGLRVEDVGSTNGTYVNLVRVDDTRLKPSDEVIIGKFHLIVVVGDE